MGGDRLKRLWSLVKIMTGELIRHENVWLSVYPQAWFSWCRVRKHYADLKVSQADLAAMQKILDEPVARRKNQDVHHPDQLNT